MTDSNELVKFEWISTMLQCGRHAVPSLPSGISEDVINNHPQYHVPMYALIPYGNEIEGLLIGATLIGDYLRSSKIASRAEHTAMEGFTDIFEQPSNRELLKCFKKFGQVNIAVTWYAAHELITVTRGHLSIRGMYLCDSSGYKPALVDWLFNQFTEHHRARYLLDSLTRGAFNNV